MPKSDIAIITVILEEYAAVATRLEEEACRLTHYPGTSKRPNQHGWVTGEIVDEQSRTYQIVLALAASPGPTHMANAVNATLARFNPRYVLLVGIAGGFSLDGLTRGDVTISSVIYDYEYGKIASEFQPRHDNVYRVDDTLFTSAVTVHARNPRWAAMDEKLRPSGSSGDPKLVTGAIASGSKVVDNAEYALFKSIHRSWQKLLAVEMEGAGAVSTINSAISGGRQVGFLMIRGISDMPKVGTEATSTNAAPDGNKEERDTWKKYAAAVAARFAVHWIKHGWPIPPAQRSSQSSDSRLTANDDSDLPPLAVPDSRDQMTIRVGPFAKTGGTPETHIPSGTLSLRSMQAILPGYQGGGDSAGATALDTELELIKTHIEKHETEVAETKLKELEVRAADRLQPHQWYQLKALRSRIFSSRWQWEQAGRQLLDAKRHMPDTERAKVNEALGYELLGDKEKAHAIATNLRLEIPESIRLLSIWVRTAPVTERFDSLAAVAAPYAKEDEELNLALAHRALLEDHFDEASAFAQRAIDLNPNSPQAWFELGQCKHASGHNIREANELYDRAIGLAQSANTPGLEATIRINRGKTRHLLGDTRAESDYQRAIELARSEQGMRTEYAGFLLQLGRPVEALRELDAALDEPTGARQFFEAAARYERNATGDRERARELLEDIITKKDSERWDDANVLLVQHAIENKTESSARDTIGQSKLRAANPFLFHTLSGWLSAAAGSKEEARSSFRWALDSLTSTTRRDQIFLLAQALVSVNEDALALPLLERCYIPGIYNTECKMLLDSAQCIERHDVVTRVCEELREAGATHPRLVEMEIGVLQLYDPDKALRLASDYMTLHPKNRHIALWQSTLAIRLNQPKLVISDLNRLPGVHEVTPHGSGLVVMILSKTDQPVAALRYAYESLRAHFDSEFAHGLYISSFLRLYKSCPDLQVGGRAECGIAVCYREELDKVDRWAIIEDSPNPDFAREEFPPDHIVSKALLGHGVGDAVVFNDSGIQPRAVTIRQAIHKFIYRFQDCRDLYQTRFPGGTAIQMVHVGSGDVFDPSPIIQSLEERKHYFEKLDEAYRTGPMPFSMYVRLAGRDEIEAWDHLAADPNLGIRCAGSDTHELRMAMELVKESKTIVVDVSALISLARLDLLSLLGHSKSCVVGQSTYEHIQHLVDAANDDSDSAGSVALANDGKLALIEMTAEQRDNRSAFITGIRDAIQKVCELRPCLKSLTLDPVRRDRVVEAVGRRQLDSILLADEPETVLWTDDLYLGVLGRTDFQIRHVWTQAVLFVLRQQDLISQKEFDLAVAKLVGWHYQGIEFNEETLVAAAEIAEWQMDRWPVPMILRALGNGKGGPVAKLRIAAQSIRSVWRRAIPEHARHGFLFALLDTINSVRLVKRLHQVIPEVFSVDVFSADEVRDCIAVWLRKPTGIILP